MAGLNLEAARRKAAEAGKLRSVQTPEPEPPSKLVTASSNYDDLDAYAEAIPDVSRHKDDFDKQMDQLIDSLSILDWYKDFCGKMTPNARGQRESIMISCPKPTHVDKNPSAWINLDKQTWFCGGCQEGGDGYDIAAHNLGFPVPGYKSGKTFHDLRKAIANKLGYTVVTGIGNKTQALIPPEGKSLPGPKKPKVVGPPPEVPPAPGAAPDFTSLLKPAGGTDTPPATKAAAPEPVVPAPSPASAPVTPPPSEPPPPPDSTEAISTAIATEAAIDADAEDDSDPDTDFEYPAIDWRAIVPKDTFLRVYMMTMAEEQIPEEYHFWNGLMAVGLALGRDTFLKDRMPVFGNLFVCTIGASGAGKSQAAGYMDRLITEALPYKWDDPTTKGSRRISTPGSGEQMIASFVRNLTLDPSKPKEVTLHPVKGLVEFGEFAGMSARASRTGSTLSTTLMEMYDMKGTITSASRTGGELVAVDPFCSVISTTQLKSIRRLMRASDADSGFLNRWIFAMGPKRERDFFAGDDAIDLTSSVNALRKITGWSASHSAVKVSVDAWKELDVWWKKVVRKYQEDDGNEMYRRIDLLVKKLLLLFSANSMQAEVTVQTVRIVQEIFPYLLRTFDAVADRIGNSEDNELSQDIHHVIASHTEKYKIPPSMRDIKRRLARKKYTEGQILKIIETLVKMQILHEEIIARGPGRPAPRYRLSS